MDFSISNYSQKEGKFVYALICGCQIEIFQNVINEQVRDIQGVINISDDIIVFGETQKKHEALEAVFRRLLRVGLTVNKEKCEFNKRSWGLSAILSQKTPGTDDRRIVAYVSRSLSATQNRSIHRQKKKLLL